MSQNKFESKQGGAKDGAEALSQNKFGKESQSGEKGGLKRLSQNKFESKQSGEKGLNGSGG